jgi:oligopeptide/dipeptide ABC transporter ATP-binding protein
MPSGSTGQGAVAAFRSRAANPAEGGTDSSNPASSSVESGANLTFCGCEDARHSPEVRMREYPHQMSGGMRQRVVGAIAMAGGPRLIIADEPTTNLDVTIQAQYLEVLKDIQQESGVALIFVTHNLGIVAKMCDKMAVMYAGKIVEHGAVRDLFRDPKHPYTQALLGSMPKLGSKEPLFAIPGQPPNLAQLPSGCAFQPRCVHAMPRCAMQEPDDRCIGPNWTAKCWLVDEQLKGQYVSATA